MSGYMTITLQDGRLLTRYSPVHETVVYDGEEVTTGRVITPASYTLDGKPVSRDEVERLVAAEKAARGIDQ